MLDIFFIYVIMFFFVKVLIIIFIDFLLKL